MGGACRRYGESRCAYRVSVVRYKENRPFGRLRRRWEGNFKMDLQEVGCGGMEWIELS
jgi:hypothetical protein